MVAGTGDDAVARLPEGRGEREELDGLAEAGGEDRAGELAQRLGVEAGAVAGERGVVDLGERDEVDGFGQGVLRVEPGGCTRSRVCCGLRGSGVRWRGAGRRLGDRRALGVVSGFLPDLSVAHNSPLGGKVAVANGARRTLRRKLGSKNRCGGAARLGAEPSREVIVRNIFIKKVKKGETVPAPHFVAHVRDVYIGDTFLMSMALVEGNRECAHSRFADILSRIRRQDRAASPLAHGLGSENPADSAYRHPARGRRIGRPRAGSGIEVRRI
jgi:hypothetical protein